MEISKDEVESLQGTEQGKSILAFNKELVPASHKTLLRSLAHGQGNQVEVFPEDIRIIPGFNPRIPGPAFDAHIRTIADSIKQRGFYKDKPVAGYAGMEGKKPVIFLTDGEVRYRAAKLAIEEGAPLETIPLVLKPEGTSLEDLTVDLVRSNGAKAFTPLELSVVCSRLRSFSWDIPKISRQLGVSGEYVGQLLMLAGSPKSLRDLVASGAATASVAIQALRQHGSDAPVVISDAVQRAKAAGKKKITAKNLPQHARKKALIKHAPDMLETIVAIRALPFYAQLPTEMQEKMAAMIKDFENTEPAAPECSGQEAADDAASK